MDLGSSQSVDGLKTFSGNVNLHSNVDVTGTVNGLDLNTDVVLTSRSAGVSGVKTFSQGIALTQPLVMGVGKTVDSVSLFKVAALGTRDYAVPECSKLVT